MVQQADNSGELTDRQKKVLEAALDVFALKGFEGASTAEIAKRAGVAEGTLFKRYRSKKELLMAVVSPFFFKFAGPSILKPVRDLVKDESIPIETVIKSIMIDRIRFVEEHWSEAKIILQEVVRVPEVRTALVDNLAKEARSFLEEFLRRRMEAGEIRTMEPFLVARSLAGMTVAFIAARHAFGLPGDDAFMEEQVDTMVDLLMNGLKRG